MAEQPLTRAVLWLERTAPLAAEAETGLVTVLSAPERTRLDRITSAKRRAEFLAGRLLLRRLLAGTFGGDPSGWVLSAPDDLPPTVLSPANGVHLALSHSGDWVAGALSATPAGLDLETPGRPRDTLALASAVCTPDERAHLATLEGPARDAAFRERWTLKEAWLKRRTEGASPGRLAQVATCPDDGGDAWTWADAGVTLAWVHEGGLPAWFRPGPFGDRPPAAWRVADSGDH